MQPTSPKTPDTPDTPTYHSDSPPSPSDAVQYKQIPTGNNNPSNTSSSSTQSSSQASTQPLATSNCNHARATYQTFPELAPLRMKSAESQASNDANTPGGSSTATSDLKTPLIAGNTTPATAMRTYFQYKIKVARRQDKKQNKKNINKQTNITTVNKNSKNTTPETPNIINITPQTWSDELNESGGNLSPFARSHSASSLHLGTPRTVISPNYATKTPDSPICELHDSDLTTDSDFSSSSSDENDDVKKCKKKKKKKQRKSKKNGFICACCCKKCNKKRKKDENNIKFTGHFGAIFNFVNTALGGALGLMGNIFAASKLGVFNFLVASAIAAVCTYFSIEFLCRSSELSQRFSTHNLAKTYFGSNGSILTKFFIFIGNWSFIVNILQIFADFAPQIIDNWINKNNSSLFTSRWFVVLVGLFIIFPWVLVKNIAKLEKLSAMCIVLVCFCFFLDIYLVCLV